MSWLTDAAIADAGAQKLIPWTGDERRDWLSRRRSGIGGSDAPIVMGLSHWKTAHWLWSNKLGLVGDGEMTEERLWGLIHEANIAWAYQHKTGRAVQAVREDVRHPTTPYRFCNPDRAAEDRLVQIKTSSVYSGWGPDGSDQIPDDYLVQVTHEMDCCGADLCDVAALICGNSLRVYSIKFNKPLAERIAEAQEKFWDLVLRRVPPPIDYGHPKTREYIEQLFPTEAGKMIEVPAGDEIIGTVADYLCHGRAERGLGELKAECRNRIIVRMGDADLMRLPDGSRVARGKQFRVYPPPEKAP